MGGKYIELAELRETVKVLTAKITSPEVPMFDIFGQTLKHKRPTFVTGTTP